MPGGLLKRRSLLLAKIETTLGVDAAPTPTADAILVEEPDYTTDPQKLERNFDSPHFSKFKSQIGRVIAGFEFTVEVRGNGTQQSGNLANTPMLARLMNACGYKLEAITTAAAMAQTDVVPNEGNSAPALAATYAKSGTVSVTKPVVYTVEVTTGGASGTAQARVTSSNTAEDADLVPAVLTSGTPRALGTKGGSVAITWSGSLAVGDKWTVAVFPLGIKATPVTDRAQHKSITLWLYKDGLLHKGRAGAGTFEITAEAGEFAKVKFKFVTTFVAAEDASLPTNAVYEAMGILPPVVELAQFAYNGNQTLFAGGWTVNVENEINPRMDVNSAQGYIGSIITDRNVTGSFSPEATLEADSPQWADFLSGKGRTLSYRIGTVAGNTFFGWHPCVQVEDQSYGDRDGILIYEKDVGFKRGPSGDDEAIFVFC